MPHKLSGSTIDGAVYTVDAVGNRTQKANLLSGGPTENYAYDSIYQLTQVAQAGPTTTESYSYDPVGNRLSSLAAATWSYNTSNQLTSISGSPGTTFAYDNNGNTTSKTDTSGTTTYAWDFENRLTSGTLPNSGGTVSFKYDPLGRRIQKATASGTTVYAYDGENIVEETNAAGAAQARFAMGLSLDEPLAQLRSGATHFYGNPGTDGTFSDKLTRDGSSGSSGWRGSGAPRDAARERAPGSVRKRCRSSGLPRVAQTLHRTRRRSCVGLLPDVESRPPDPRSPPDRGFGAGSQAHARQVRDLLECAPGTTFTYEKQR